MELQEAIITRRTIKDFKPDAVPSELLMRALEAGIWAQNHRMTQPWRFDVFGPQTHRALAEIYADVQLESVSADDEIRDKARQKAIAKILAKPQLVSVSSTLSPDAQVRREDYAAVCCAIQNIQLAAWDLGLGMQWSTSGALIRPATYELLGINPTEEEIVGILFFGFPSEVPKARPRRPIEDLTRHVP